MEALTTQEMIEALVKSDNQNVAKTCSEILNGTKTIKEVIKYCGSFLNAVLRGDFEDAIDRADYSNRICLEIASKKKELLK